MSVQIPQMPKVGTPFDSIEWYRWLHTLGRAVGSAGGVAWASIDFTGSNITNIATRQHNDLQALQGGNATERFHLSSAQSTAINGYNSVATKTANYTVTANDGTLLGNATTGAITFTLPSAVGLTGKRYAFKKTDSSQNIITLKGNGAELIDAANTFVIQLQYQTINLVSDGTQWWVYADYLDPLPSVVTKTATYTATLSDRVILCDATAGAMQVNLPTTASTMAGRRYTIKKIDATLNNVTIDGHGTDNIDGSNLYTMHDQYDSVIIVSDGANWWVEGENVKQAKTVVTKTATYTTTLKEDVILCDATAGAMTINLITTSALPGQQYCIKKIDVTANAVTISGHGADKIDGAASYTLAAQWNSVILVNNGTDWFVEGKV